MSLGDTKLVSFNGNKNNVLVNKSALIDIS